MLTDLIEEFDLKVYKPYYAFEYIKPNLLIGEIFKVIPLYCDYLASNYGRIWSIKSKIILKQIVRKRDGYLEVKLRANGTSKCITVHQLILKTFKIKPFETAICRHLDGDNKNNILSNLEWGTHKENTNDSILHGTSASLRGENHHSSILSTKEVDEIKEFYKSRKYNQYELAKKYNINQSQISRIISGKRRPRG